MAFSKSAIFVQGEHGSPETMFRGSQDKGILRWGSTNLYVTKFWLCCDIRLEKGGKVEQQYTYSGRVTHDKCALLRGDALSLVLMNKQRDPATRKWRRRGASAKKVDCTCDPVI